MKLFCKNCWGCVKPCRLNEGENLERYPILYKQSSTGKLLTWEIGVVEEPRLAGEATSIITRHGQEGAKIQEIAESITEGKNLGKKNATTHFQQACLQAKAKWVKQQERLGYNQDRGGALRGVSLLKVKPMLAHVYPDHASKIKWPCIIQPKFDGIRANVLINLDNNTCEIYSRTGKKFTSLGHIEQYILKHLKEVGVTGSHILDGELYNHDYRDNFEKIVSLVRSQEPQVDSKDVQLHVYDLVSDDTQIERLRHLYVMFPTLNTTVQLVRRVLCSVEGLVEAVLEEFLEAGYEGIMLRNQDAKYAHKRSYDLQKYKRFLSEEFCITGVQEGKGKLAGHAGAFLCETREGKPFKAKMTGSFEMLKEYFENKELWEGKQLTVKFQEYTKLGVPRFGVGIAIRDYE